jgi:glycosyltransferase involved in cell wall biosynthesis
MRVGISAVVPVYNSAEGLAKLVERIDGALSRLDQDYEIVLVDDGSSDASWDTLTSLATDYKVVNAIRLQRNSGQHSALLCGIRNSCFDKTVTLDDDLQNPPEEIPRLLERLSEGFDVVYGFPLQQQHGFVRNFASRLTKRMLQGSMGAENAERISAFRAFRTEVRESFAEYNNPFVSIDVLLTWGTSRFSSVTVRHDRRQFSASGYSWVKLLNHASNLMTGFTTAPLQFASLLGFSFSILGLVAFSFSILRWVFDRTSVAGFTFLASAITLFAGVQLLCLGIMGEYLARIHSGLTGRRPYTVAERAGSERRGKPAERRGATQLK